jgi:hypothetical protein
MCECEQGLMVQTKLESSNWLAGEGGSFILPAASQDRGPQSPPNGRSGLQAIGALLGALLRVWADRSRDGAAAARFLTHLKDVLEDFRRAALQP